MGDPAITQQMSAEAYLAWERHQDAKHEYHHGSVFAMAGGSPRHNFLANAAGAELRAAVRGKGCYVLSSDQRIAADEGQRYVYADAVVVCGTVELVTERRDVLANPTIVVEVLSPSTETYDRGDKWDAYRRLESLRDYLLVAQGSVHVEHYRREGNGAWRYRVAEAGDTVELSDGATLEVDAVYAGAFDLELG